MQDFSSYFLRMLNYLSTISFWDVIDILIVAYLFYKVIDLVRKTSSYNLAKGILLLLIFLWLSGPSVFNLTMINFILRKAVEIGLIALVIIFQPELRKLLSRMGSKDFYGIFSQKTQITSKAESAITQTVLACEQMSKTKTGALIIFEHNMKLSDIMTTGTIINADITAELLKNIFYPKAPLHDGALIIRNFRIAAAGCVLPLTAKTNLSKDLGMRHRAGIGASEISDAITVIVSEETGGISVAIDGMLKRNLSVAMLEQILRKELVVEETKKSTAAEVFLVFDKHKVNKDGTEKRTKKIYDSKVFWMIISLLCSLMMWAYVTSQDTTDKNLTFTGIPVEFQGQEELLSERDLSITDVSADSVSIVVKGNRSTISKLKASDIKAVIDVSSITAPNNMTWTYKLVFPNYVNENEISVVRKNPDTINFTVIKNGSKTVDIKGSFGGTIAEGCVAEEFVFDPKTLTIDGPEEIINKIDHVWVEFGKNQTIDSAYVEEAEFTLRDKNDNIIPKDGLRFSEETVTATQPILKTKELPLNVRFISGGGITESDCDVTIDPSSIKVAGDSRIIDDMESIEIGTIDLSSFSSGYEHTFAIELPDGVQNLTGVSDAKVTVEVNGSHTKTFTTSNIACKGVSNGYHATIDTKEIEVTLRALSQDALNRVKPEDITVIADLSDYGSTTGQIIVNAKVSVAGHDNVGAVGDVRVTVTIYKD